MRFLSFAIFGCAFLTALMAVTFTSSKPNAIDFASEGIVDLGQEIENFKETVNSPAFDAKMCVEVLSLNYRRLLQATPKNFAATQANRARFIQSGAKFVHDIFFAKLALRERLKELEDQHRMTEACLNSARDIYRASRVLEDIVGDAALHHPAFNEKNPPNVLVGGEPWLLLNPKFGNLQLRSGDLILSRGTAFTSAAIARLGNSDANFSHVSMVYVDPKTHATFVSEAQIETGSFSGPLSVYLTDGKSRAAVYRHRNPQLAALASAKIRHEILNYQLTHNGKMLPYDPSMNMKDPSRLYCAELVSHAFDLAVGGAGGVPAHLSKITPKNRTFVTRIGVKAQTAFLPMDIEIDPNFELVAEWRDYSQMNTSHMQDAVLTSMMDWMERGGYTLHDRLSSTLKTSFAYEARQWPLFSSLLEKSVPECLSSDTMSAITTLNESSQILYDALRAQNEATLKTSGDWLTPAQMQQYLNDFRHKDFIEYRVSHGFRGPLHQVFRAGT